MDRANKLCEPTRFPSRMICPRAKRVSREKGIWACLRFILRALVPSLLVIALAACLPASAQQVPPTFFGLNDLYAGQNASLASPWPAVPFGALRLWDSGTDWKLIETARGVYNWSTLDNWIYLAQSQSVPVEFTFGRTPSWAASKETLPPANMQDWDNFVQAVVTRYKGRIESYETWNEVNSTSFYTGTMAQLVTMQQHAYAIIKSIDPAAIVLSPSFAGGGMNYMKQFLAAGGAPYFDVLAIHPYPWPQKNPTPEASIAGWISTYRSYLTQYGAGGRPIWDTEYSWGLNSDLPNADNQAAFLARSYLLQWSSQVSRLYWYAYDNSSWGTLRLANSGNPGKLTKAAQAYQAVYSWIVGATLAAPCSEASGGTWSCAFSRPGGYQALVVWNPTRSVSFGAPREFESYRTLYGLQGAISGPLAIGPEPLLLETANPTVASTTSH